jgi:hypothetical protein
MTALFHNLQFCSVAVFAFLAGWVRSHVWSRGLRARWKGPAMLGRAGLGFLTLLAAAGLADHAIVFATTWQVWPILLAGAVLIEVVMAISRLERNIVSRRAGRALSLLRVTAVLAVVLTLCQPVRVFDTVKTLQRHVVVLLDVSASMQVVDNNLTPAERLRLSEAIDPDTVRRPFPLDRLAARLRASGQDLASQTEWLSALSKVEPDLRRRQLRQNASARGEGIREVRRRLAEAGKSLEACAAAPFLQKEGSGQAAALKRFTARLADEAIQPVEKALGATAEWSASSNRSDAAYDTVRQELQHAAAFLADTGGLVELGEAVDEVYYKSLGRADRDAVDRVVSRQRSALVRDLLLGRAGTRTNGAAASPESGLLARLNDEYGVRLYTFDTAVDELKPGTLRMAPDAVVPRRPGDEKGQGTDLAGVLEKVQADNLPGQTAGVVLFSDGRNNASGNPESVARQYGVQGVPLFPVVMGGGSRPPTDAAIVSVEAPESVATNSRAAFNVEVKLDGVSSSNVTVTLFDGTVPVASNTLATSPSAFAVRKQIQLSHTPRTSGMHAYHVDIGASSGDVQTANNTFPIPVYAGSDPLKVLMIDGGPRWEFRYLKNLFTQRDSNVRLQYLLFHPDTIAGVTNRPRREASVTGDPGESEATHPPASEAEWMKFDLIILGDVAPDELGAGNLVILRKFVQSRGGSLIVMAGNRFMPQAYAGTPLADILPVTFRPAVLPLLAAPENEFRLALTAEGRHTVFLKLEDDPAANREAWKSVPALYWRNGNITAKDGATVLAYAAPVPAGESGPADSIPDADTLVRQQQKERESPLIITHQAGFGSVLMFGSDQTWRLRYKKGDLYHHRLWGQILRHAAGDGFASGSDTVKLGTSRTRYPRGGNVQVKARLATANFRPVTNAVPVVVIVKDGKPVLRRPLSYREGSGGVYIAELGSLPQGIYRAELETTGTPAVTAGGKGRVASEFAVTAGVDSETVELTADRGLMTTLARLTAGSLIEPTELDSLPSRLGPSRITTTERRQIDLWNSWPWLMLILVLLSAEWVVRKKVRLP